MATTYPLQNAILVSETTAKSMVKNEFRFMVIDQVSMAAGATRTYNVATLLAAEAGLYDLKTIDLDIHVIDTEVGSATNGYLVNGDAVIASGFKVTGEVTVTNTFDSALTVLIRVRVNKKIS